MHTNGQAVEQQVQLVSPRPKCRRLTGLRVLGTGSYVPDGIVTNDFLGQHYGCDPEWIIRRTGITERRHALPHQATSDLCYEAGRRCIASAGVDPSDIDMLVIGTYTPDMTFPSVACLIQERLGLTCAAMDVQAACAGFMYALITGATYVKAGVSKLCLIMGGDTNSRIADPKDPKTYPLFGDGAGAILIAPSAPEYGILSYSLGSDGRGSAMLNRPACGSRMPPSPDILAQGLQYLHMDGRAVFRWAVGILGDTVREVLDHCEHTIDDVSVFIPHQANIRIINAAMDVLKIPRDRVYSNLSRYGNTSAASIPIALDECIRSGKLKRDGIVVMSGFGAGLAWGTAAIRW